MRGVVRNIRNDDKSRPGKGKQPVQSKRSNQKGNEKPVVKAKVDTGRKPKEDKLVNNFFLTQLFNKVLGKIFGYNYEDWLSTCGKLKEMVVDDLNTVPNKINLMPLSSIQMQQIKYKYLIL